DEEMAKRKLVSSHRREQKCRTSAINRLHGMFMSQGITSMVRKEAEHLLKCLVLHEERERVRPSVAGAGGLGACPQQGRGKAEGAVRGDDGKKRDEQEEGDSGAGRRIAELMYVLMCDGKKYDARPPAPGRKKQGGEALAVKALAA
ncbi:MAG: hypothetical protein FWD94_07425, partial [Treponema sp.]|nr:hypothetical protein [Treponema sp.]